MFFFFHEKIQHVWRSKLSRFTGEDLDQVPGSCELASCGAKLVLVNSCVFPPARIYS